MAPRFELACCVGRRGKGVCDGNAPPWIGRAISRSCIWCRCNCAMAAVGTALWIIDRCCVQQQPKTPPLSSVLKAHFSAHRHHHHAIEALRRDQL